MPELSMIARGLREYVSLFHGANFAVQIPRNAFEAVVLESHSHLPAFAPSISVVGDVSARRQHLRPDPEPTSLR